MAAGSFSSKSFSKPPKPAFRNKGFEPAFSLVKNQLRKVGETRGFALSRLLTQWIDIMGEDLGHMVRPIKVNYGRDGGMGATLVVLTVGAYAPIVTMRLDEMRKKANAAYGYNAISRVVVTQTAITGFAEGQVEFVHKAKKSNLDNYADAQLTAQINDKALNETASINDPDLRSALETLANNIYRRTL